MPGSPAFGVSTHLFHGQRLDRACVREIAAAGFGGIELFATRTHFDYHSAPSIDDLRGWLAEAGLTLYSVHAPVGERYDGVRWEGLFNLASADEERRRQALDEALVALHVARRLPFSTLVVHAGVPRPQQAPGSDSRDAAGRSIEALASAAAPLGVRIAVEVIPNPLSAPASLVHFIEDVLEAGSTGICLDFGHANLDGDVLDAIETVSEHLMAVHLHDNGGRTDEHLIPFEGTIDWPGALTNLRKVGFDGPMVLEVARRGSVKDTLARARAARTRMERFLAVL
ncbi:MAG: sugar phosphate isomerase/epimerase family protein [Vicinamibacterales bacterium]